VDKRRCKTLLSASGNYCINRKKIVELNNFKEELNWLMNTASVVE